MQQRIWIAAMAAAGWLFAPGPGAAFDKFDIRALGWFQGQLQSSDVERPFFDKLPQESGGKIAVRFRTMDEVGLKGFDAMRQLASGVFDVMAISFSYVSGDDPFFYGVDLPGVALDVPTQRKVADAYRAEIDKRLREKFNGQTVAMWSFPAQMFFCKGNVRGLDDLKGKKIRVSGPLLATLVEQFGAVGVSLPFNEVYPALQRGVIDCGITGSLSGNTSSWPEVTDSFLPLTTGWGVQAHIVNLDFWNKLQPDARDFLAAQFKKMENDLWELAAKTTDDGINCNVGVQPCKYGKPGKMTLVKISDADAKRFKEAAEKAVLQKWLTDCKRTTPDCAAIWNDTVGKAVNMRM